MLHTLTEPWRDPLTRRALVEVLLLGVVGGTLGCWIVFFRLSYGAESLAHGLLPGLVLAALAGLPLVLGAGAGLLVAAVGVALAGRVPGLGPDTAVSVVVSGLFGLGALLALSPATPARLGDLLFGDVLGTTGSDLLVAGGLAALVLAALWLAHPSLLLTGFDRAAAPVLGRSPLAVDLGLGALLAVALLVAVQALGTLLVVAVLVAPAAAARRLTRRMGSMMAVAVAVAVAGGVGGLYASYYLDTAAGASIAAALVLAYLLSAGLPPRLRW
jgi:ABC-type Mn2+/Zn2+ transport system permease subunit